LRQILLNLVGNAVKFTETGSVTLKAGFADGQLQFEVRDTGTGIPGDQFDKLFKRFSQVDGTSRRSHGGTGLGLAICKGLAEAMGGSIDARSRQGEGSIFSVRIPSAVVESPAAASEENPTLTSFEGLRILVADDNKANRMLIAAMLQPVGVQLALASTGREALELATARRFDVILMDLHMPEMDGYDATHTIRSGTGPSSATPVLAFTADSELRTEGGHASVKFQGVVCKPVMQKALLDAIAGAVGLSADAYPVEKARAARTA
jgi:CheY-like chemotaxis protein